MPSPLTLAFCSETKRIQHNFFLRKLILKPDFVLRGTDSRFESISGKSQLQECHNTNQMFKCLRLAAFSYLSIRALLSTNDFRNLRSKPRLEAKLNLVLPINPQPTVLWVRVNTLVPVQGPSSAVLSRR